MAARRYICVAIAGLLLTAGVSACGGSSKAPKQGNGDAASQLSTTMKARLTAVGYKPLPPGALIGDPLHPPIPEQAFTVEVDPKSPESFTVTFLVFHSAKDAALFDKHNNATCNAIPSCKKAKKANYGQNRQQRIASVIYGATSDSGTSVVPVAQFTKVIAQARGLAK